MRILQALSEICNAWNFLENCTGFDQYEHGLSQTGHMHFSSLWRLKLKLKFKLKLAFNS